MTKENTLSKPLIAIIAGESSGDSLGAKLIVDLRKEYPNCEFFGIGGEQMKQVGFNSLFEMTEINLFGFAEIFTKIVKLKGLIKLTAEKIKEVRPDILITIDSPGFNFRVVEKLRASKVSMPIIHYVAPSVWAYNHKRVHTIANLYDQLITILPFEKVYFEGLDLKVDYVGHPIYDEDTDIKVPKSFIQKYNLVHDKIIGLTPGSRAAEIERILPIYCQALNKLKNKNFDIILPVAQEEHKSLITKIAKEYNLDVKLVDFEDRFKAYKCADLFVTKSGTNTLEISALGTAQIISYKLNWLTWRIIKMKVKIKHANILNIMAKRAIIPELLQEKCNVMNLKKKIAKFIGNISDREMQLNDIKPFLNQLKSPVAGKKPRDLAADVIIKWLQR